MYGSLTRNKYFSDGWDIAFNVSVFSLGPRLSPWHCPQLLLLSAVLRPRAAVGRPASAAVGDNYLLPARRSAANPPSNDGTDGRTEGQPTITPILLLILCAHCQQQRL